MRIVYPLQWSRLAHQACRDQSVSTAAALARQGAEVTLVLPRRRDDPLLAADDIRRWFGVDGDFALVQLPSRWAGTSALRGALWLRRLLGQSFVREADLLYSRIPLMLAAGAAVGLPFVTDHYRTWPDDWPWLRPLIRLTARRPNCLGFVLHSAYAAASYARLGIDPAKILVAHNGADLGRFAPSTDAAAVRARLGLPSGRAIAVYAGSIDRAKGLDQLLAVARLRPEMLFLLVGAREGDGIAAAAGRLDNVRLVPWQPPELLPDFLHAADVLLVPPSSAPLARFRNCVLPMKVFNYLAAGRPILAPASPDTAELLRHGDNAWLVEPDLPEVAAATLDRLLNEPGLAGRLGRGAAATAASLGWDDRAARILAFLRARLAAGHPAAVGAIAPC